LDYDSLLDRALKQLPEKKSSGERFEVPRADVLIEGNKTIVRNFEEICGKLRRKPEEVSKFLFKEMAMPGEMQGQRLVMVGRAMTKLVNDKIAYYTQTHVLCRECGKPDTHLEGGDRHMQVLVCEACGAKTPVRK
jgi:translation initiation factor 2 subunit 2